MAMWGIRVTRHRDIGVYTMCRPMFGKRTVAPTLLVVRYAITMMISKAICGEHHRMNRSTMRRGKLI